MQNFTNGKYQYMLFKNAVASVLITDAQSHPTSYIYFTSWVISGKTLTLVREDGTNDVFEVSKEYNKVSATAFNVTVYIKNSTGEYAYTAVPDGSNNALAEQMWTLSKLQETLSNNTKGVLCKDLHFTMPC